LGAGLGYLDLRQLLPDLGHQPPQFSIRLPFSFQLFRSSTQCRRIPVNSLARFRSGWIVNPRLPCHAAIILQKSKDPNPDPTDHPCRYRSRSERVASEYRSSIPTRGFALGYIYSVGSGVPASRNPFFRRRQLSH